MEVVHAMRIIIKFIRKLRFTKKNEMEMNFILCVWTLASLREEFCVKNELYDA